MRDLKLFPTSDIVLVGFLSTMLSTFVVGVSPNAYKFSLVFLIFMFSR